MPLIREYAPSKSILGVCLGHQAIGEAFGGKLINLSTVYHGVATPIRILRDKEEERIQASAAMAGSNQSKGPASKHVTAIADESQVKQDLFKDLPRQFEVGRYHSWIVANEEFPDELEVTARDENDYIMALQHKQYDVQGVQFHPESVLTPLGEQILRNWLRS